ncbi:hypothetical protein PISMIDRAFT_685108, partial [Pisolithus microcarpus 441]
MRRTHVFYVTLGGDDVIQRPTHSIHPNMFPCARKEKRERWCHDVCSLGNERSVIHPGVNKVHEPTTASGRDSSVAGEQSRFSSVLTLTQHTSFSSRVLVARHSPGVLMALQCFAHLFV